MKIIRKYLNVNFWQCQSATHSVSPVNRLHLPRCSYLIKRRRPPVLVENVLATNPPDKKNESKNAVV